MGTGPAGWGARKCPAGTGPACRGNRTWPPAWPAPSPAPPSGHASGSVRRDAGHCRPGTRSCSAVRGPANRDAPTRAKPDGLGAGIPVGLEAGDDLRRDPVAEQHLDLPEEPGLVHAHQRDRLAGGTCAAGPADAMDVIRGDHGQLVVDDVRQQLDVQSAGREIRRDEHTHASRLEVGERSDPSRLALVAVDRRRVDAVGNELLGEPVRAVLRAGEHERLVHASGPDQVREERAFPVAIDAQDHLGDEVGRRVARGDLDRGGVVEQGGRQRADARRERRGEEEALPSPREEIDDPADVRDEPHVQEPIGLVQDQDLDRGQVDRALACVIQQPAGGRDDDLRAPAERAGLSLETDAPEDGTRADGQMGAIRPDALLDLQRELARRLDDQDARGPTAARVPGHVASRHGRGAKELQDRQDERGRLAGAGLGGSEQIASGQNDRDRLALHRGRVEVSLVRDGAEELGRQPEVRERHGHAPGWPSRSTGSGQGIGGGSTKGRAARTGAPSRPAYPTFGPGGSRCPTRLLRPPRPCAGVPRSRPRRRGARRATGPRRDRRTEDDQTEPHGHADRERFAQHQYAEHGRHRRIDVRDHGGPYRTDLVDERGEQQERDSRADDGQDRDGHEHVRAGQHGGVLDRHDRRIRERAERQGHGHDADRRQAAEAPGEDGRTDRIADHDERHLEQCAGVGRVEVDADDRGDAHEPDQEAGESRRADPVAPPRREGDDHPDERHTRDQETGQRAAHSLLGGREEHPRHADLDRGEGCHPAPAAEHGPEVRAKERERHQDQRRQSGPGEDQGRRLDLGDGHTDEQVRDAPDQRHEAEQHDGAARHPCGRRTPKGSRFGGTVFTGPIFADFVPPGLAWRAGPTLPGRSAATASRPGQPAAGRRPRSPA